MKNLNIGERIVILSSALLILIGVPIGVYNYNKDEKMFENTSVTEATVVRYGSTMGNLYIHYMYRVDNVEYETKKRVNGIDKKSLPVGITDMKIEYAIEDPELTKIIDERVK